MEENATETSDQSEFNSDAEEVEFGLYASLYFEPNPDFLPVQNIASVKNGNQTKNICTQKTQQQTIVFDSDICAKSIPDAHLKIDCLTEEVINDTIVNNKLNRNGQKGDKHPDKGKVESNHTKLVGETQSSRIDLDDEVNNEIGHNVNSRNHSMKNIKKKNSKHNNKIDAQKQSQHVTSGDAKIEKRVRQSSICSVDSIAGNAKLDSLYTMNFSSSDEDDYQQELDSKLAINNIILKKNKEKGITSQNKRKRDVKESDKSESDDNLDSKCHIMNRAVKKKKLDGGNKKVYKEIDSSESDSDIYVLPPPKPKPFETLYVPSETESESHEQTIIENIEGSVHKVMNDSGLCSTKSSTQLLKSKNLACQSSEIIPKKGMLLSIDDYSSKTKTKKKKQSKEKKSSKDCIIISEDSDDSIDIAEISKGTDLVMNLGGGLNSFIERPVTKKTKEKKKKKSEKGMLSSITGDRFSNADYTQGRLLTTKIPSCKKWTPEMASFYDSDISEDLEIEDIHAQQSDSPLLWNIIPSDYPIKGRRRYFNQQVPRCKRCRQFGHAEKDCPRTPRCHLCSGTDHVVRYQCPNNCCFRCGGEPHAFCQNTLNTTICELCGWPGHNTNICPDLWRRFHNTTSGIDPQPPVLLNNNLRPRSEAYCYCCSRRGHFGHECPDRQQIRSCLPVDHSIVSYAPPVLLHEGETVINLEGCESPREEAAYNPVTKIKIKMKDGGRILGKSGVIVKDIERRTRAKVNVVNINGKQMVCVYGDAEARKAAKNLVEVLLEKRSPDGLENYVIHVAKINNDPSVLNILKKSTGSYGKISPNINKTIYNDLPNVVSSNRDHSKEDVYQTNMLKVSQERKIFNESPRKRLKEDESLKEDFLSLNPKSAPFKIREDQESQSLKAPAQSNESLSNNDILHKDFRSLIPLNKSLKQSCQLSKDASLQEDFLSLKTPKRMQLRKDDDIRILESYTDIRSEARQLNNNAKLNKTDNIIEELAGETSNSVTELQKTTRLALEEEIDNLGIQVKFMKGLTHNLPRKKDLLLEKSKNLLARIDSMDYNIPSIVSKIRKNRRIFTQADPAFERKMWLKKNLQMVSMVVVGQERMGSGTILRRNLECLLKMAKASKGKASQQLVTDISEIFKKICDPSVKQIDEMLRLAKIYMQRYPQGKSNVTAHVANPKNVNKKQKVFIKEKKKKKINDQGKLKKLESPNSFKKKNKDVTNEFDAMSRKCLEFNRKPKKNKKKKQKYHTKDGKRNWNAVFNNS